MSNVDYQEAIRIAKEAPVDGATVALLMNRPAQGQHVPVESLYLDVEHGITGDRWKDTAWLKLADGSPDPRIQVSLTNKQVMQCFTHNHPEGVFACGDNIYTDLNLSEAVLPAGTRLQIGQAIITISNVENDACGKFVQRFGVDAFKCIRDDQFRKLRLRGLFASVVKSGLVRRGDRISFVKMG